MYCNNPGIIIKPNSTESGKTAETRAYGFDGKSPYHFSRIYLRPCAIKIVNGKMKKITALGLKPVIMMVKIIRSVAMELREAKKPLVVEKMPIRAMANVGRLISGDKNTLSRLARHEKTGAMPFVRFLTKSLKLKFFANNNSCITGGLLMILIINAETPAIINKLVIISGSFGRLLIIKRRCGCRKTKRTQNTAK